jgi:hypothetical protein
MARVPSDDHLLELPDGRTIGYAIVHRPRNAGIRLDRYAGLDDPEWVRRRRPRFIGVDRPGYGHSDPWPEANLLVT